MSWFCFQSNTLSGLVKEEGSSESKSRGIIFQSQASGEKKGKPKLGVCPSTGCIWPAQNQPKSVPQGRAVHVLGAGTEHQDGSPCRGVEMNVFAHEVGRYTPANGRCK